ncbi:MAG: type II 3-dehydroquinate dehydratase [Hyphomicrobiales bacterium]
MSKPIYVLNGPNLNLLGTRETDIYGKQTLDDIARLAAARARTHGLTVDFRQSNDEGELVDWIQEARQKGSALVVNAGAYTHTSVAILDALLAADIPCVEVHLSNIFRREEFRHQSYVSRAAIGIICGFGAKGYELAIDALATRLGGAK